MMQRYSKSKLCLLVATLSLSIDAYSSWLGDTRDIRTASDLAISCKTDEALKALDRAEAGGGLGTYVADLERVAILRDVGREKEAAKALDHYLELPEAKSTPTADIESSIEKTIEKLRHKRMKHLGVSTCP